MVFELTSDLPDSDFHFDFEECNICLKSRYFNVIPVQLMPAMDFTVLIFRNSLTNTMKDIRTEGKAAE